MPPHSPFLLRRRWQQLLQLRNVINPFLATLFIINFSWTFYDIKITSQERHRPKREVTKVTESSPLSPFYPPKSGMEYVGFARAFPAWRSPFPCGLMEDERAMRSRTSATEGLFYVNELEVAPSIFSSITARMARNMGKRQQKKPGDTIAARQIDELRQNATAKVCTTRFLSQRARRYQDRLPKKSFLWSVVREPVDRLVSKYYHYAHHESKSRKRQTVLSRFQNFVFNSENQDYGYYFRSLGVHRKLDPYKKEHEIDTQELLESFDFLGVSERMDESLAVLKILLNLDIQDVLYMPVAKSSSRDDADYYENWRKDECRPIAKPEVTLEMKQWFYSEEFEAFIEADVLFYKAVNASLDKTISTLGHDLVGKTVEQIRLAQKVVEEKCKNTRFPCSAEGQFQKETDCLFSNIGCGYDCLDEMGKFLSGDPRFQSL